MKLNIAFPDQNRFIDTEVPDDLSLEEFKTYIEAETGVRPLQQILEHESISLQYGNESLGNLGLSDDDVIVLHTKPENTQNTLTVQNSTAQLGSMDYEHLRQQALAHPEIRAQLNPAALAAIRNPVDFHSKMKDAESKARQQYITELRDLQENADLPENQKKLMEMIRRERIQKNLQLAYEITPEAFVNTSLLLIKLSINGHETHALVDSGAQKSVILKPIAESFGLHDLIDTAFAGMSRGVGSQESPGRIHSVPVVLGDTNLALPCAFQVLEVGFPVLLGLDMLKSHRCVIDLSKSALVVGEYEIPFIAEHEVERLTLEAHKETPTSTGNKVGAGLNPAFQRPVGTSAGANAAQAASLRLATNLLNTPPTSSMPAATQSSSTNEDGVKQLQALGFSRNEALEALQLSNGNVEMAAAYLFQ